MMHLPDADRSRLVRMYREFLIRATASKWLDRLESVLNFVCPKSIIVYGERSNLTLEAAGDAAGIASSSETRGPVRRVAAA